VRVRQLSCAPKKALQIFSLLFITYLCFGEFIEQTGKTLFQIKICILNIILELKNIHIFSSSHNAVH
jgi:hypothetical protein